MSMEFKPTGVEWGAGGKFGTVKFGDDSNLLVMFYNKAVEIPAKSQQLGRRYCENQIYVKIQHPGETHNIIDRPIKDEDKHRFARHWQAFVMNRTQVPEGTPIDLLFPNNPSFAENLRAMGIYTVEQCSQLSATAIESIGRGGQETVNRAKQYLENANKGADWHAFKKKETEWEQKFRMLEQQNADLRARLDAYLMRDKDPVKASLSPPFVEGYDPQAERINANHVTSEIAKKQAQTKTFVPDAIPAEPTFPSEFEDMLK